MTSRSSSEASMGESTASASSTGRRSRKSLDELLAMQRARDADFNDMPSLSSFRADDLSAVTSASYTSFASNSRGGDSRAGDCDVSLPSLSSFRLEDLSTCSSYHSVQTVTNHLSDQSAEGWGSFTSGNVSAETDSDDGKRRARIVDNGDKASSAPQKPSRNSSGSSLTAPTSQYAPPLPPRRGVLRRDSSMDSSTATPTRSSNPKDGQQTNKRPMKRPTRTVSPVPTGDDGGLRSELDQATPMNTATTNARPPARTSSDTNSPERTPVARTESLQLEFLQELPQKDSKSNSMSMESLRNSSVTDGSSSSLRGGDSLPRLPRRTSTVDVPRDEISIRSNLSDASTKISDDEVTRISEGDVSLASDVESDLSIETDTEHVSLVGDHSERSIEDTSQEPGTGADGRSDALQTSSNDPTPAPENVEDDVQPARMHPEEITTESYAATAAHDAVAPETAAKKDSPERGTQEEDPPSRRLANESSSTKNDSDKSGGTSAEESGATTDTYADDPEGASKEPKDGENKRGKLLRKVSSSFRSIGKTASFRSSFKMIGKQASKLKLNIGARRQAGEGKESKPPPNELESKDI